MNQCILGIDVGKSNIRVAISEGTSELKYYYKQPYRSSSAGELESQLTAAIGRALDESGRHRDSVAAIGIDVPAIVNRENGTILYGPDFDYMGDYSITQRMSELYGVPVVADVDTVMATWGELWAGVGIACKNFAIITWGTGLGAGLVVAGAAIEGANSLFPEFGDPISEAAIAGCAVGAALLGMRPIVEIMYIDFITLAMDQIVNHAAKWPQLSGGKVKMPIVFRTQGGAGRRNSSQHSQSLENWFVGIPGLIVVMPATPRDMKGLLKSAVRNDNPVVFIEHKAPYFAKGDVPTEEYLIPLGVADVKRTGSDITIVATSWMVSHALSAAEKLASEGISCEVVDPRTLWPLDKQTICDSARKTRRCMVVVEAPIEGGWSGEAAAVVQEECFHDLEQPVRRLGAARGGIPYGPVLERLVVPSEEAIMKAAREMMDSDRSAHPARNGNPIRNELSSK